MFRATHTDVKVHVESSLAEQKQCNTNLASKLTQRKQSNSQERCLTDRRHDKV